MYCSSINDVFVSCGFDSMGYADDNIGTRIFPAYSSMSNFCDVIPDCLRSLKAWADKHFLKLNSCKTKLMVFGNSSFMADFDIHTVRNYDGSIISISKEVKLLGVTLDSTLSLDAFVSEISSSINLTLRNIRSIRKYLTQSAVETLIHSLITSKLDSCNSLFLGLSKKNKCKLQLLQNAALRCVIDIPPHARISQHYVDLHWLHVEKRVYHKLLTTVFKCINNMAPTQVMAKLKMHCPLQMLLDSSDFIPSSSWGRRSFRYMAPRCWNALPIELRIISSLEHFKSKLKGYLFTDFRRFRRNIDPYTSVSLLNCDEQADDVFLLNYILASPFQTERLLDLFN